MQSQHKNKQSLNSISQFANYYLLMHAHHQPALSVFDFDVNEHKKPQYYIEKSRISNKSFSIGQNTSKKINSTAEKPKRSKIQMPKNVVKKKKQNSLKIQEKQIKAKIQREVGLEQPQKNQYQSEVENLKLEKENQIDIVINQPQEQSNIYNVEQQNSLKIQTLNIGQINLLQSKYEEMKRNQQMNQKPEKQSIMRFDQNYNEPQEHQRNKNKVHFQNQVTSENNSQQSQRQNNMNILPVTSQYLEPLKTEHEQSLEFKESEIQKVTDKSHNQSDLKLYNLNTHEKLKSKLDEESITPITNSGKKQRRKIFTNSSKSNKNNIKDDTIADYNDLQMKMLLQAKHNKYKEIFIKEYISNKRIKNNQ